MDLEDLHKKIVKGEKRHSFLLGVVVGQLLIILLLIISNFCLN